MNEVPAGRQAAEIEQAIAARQELVQKISKMTPKNLLDRLAAYKIRMGSDSPLDNSTRRLIVDSEELHSYHRAEMNHYPRMDLEEEAVMSEIIEVAKGKRGGWDGFADEAESYLIGSKLAWIDSIAHRYYGFTSNRLSTRDLYQTGCETLVKTLPDWHWQDAALSTFTYNRIRNAMSKEIAADRGKSRLMDSRIKDIKTAKDLWNEAKGDKPTNKELSQAMVIYYLQPDLKLSEKEDNLRKVLIQLGTSLKIFGEDSSKTAASTLIDIAQDRLDISEEIDAISTTVQGDAPIRDDDGEGGSIFDLIGEEMDRSSLAPAKIREFEDLVEALLERLSERQKDAIRFMILKEKKTMKELAAHLGMSERNAQNFYQRAIGKASSNLMARRNLLNFFDQEDYL